MDVADVPGVVIAGDHDDRVARDPVEVALRLLVLVLEAEGGQVARADDDVRAEVVDLADRTLEQARHEVLPAAMEIGEVGDRERVGRCGAHVVECRAVRNGEYPA